MLIVTRDESPLVYRAPAASEDSKFDCSTALFQVTMYSHTVQAVHTESRYKCQFGSNSLLFTPFKTV